MVVGFAAGGGTDVLGRIIGRKLSEVLGQQVVIENVGGAGGMVGLRARRQGAAGRLPVRARHPRRRHQPDALQEAAYNFVDDLVPVVLFADQPTILITRNEFPAGTMPEFIAYVKKNQATMQVASAGAGSTGHVDCQCSTLRSGVNVTHVPYRGGGPAMQDIIGGRIDYSAR